MVRWHANFIVQQDFVPTKNSVTSRLSQGSPRQCKHLWEPHSSCDHRHFCGVKTVVTLTLSGCTVPQGPSKWSVVQEEAVKDSSVKAQIPVVTQYGRMWARNTDNIKHIPGSKEGGKGIYVLFDGSMPLYVGKGNIRSRIKGHRRSKSKGQLWDRFSWYALSDPRMMHDIEVMVLKLLPTYLRALTKQGGSFLEAKRIMQTSKKACDYITRES